VLTIYHIYKQTDVVFMFEWPRTMYHIKFIFVHSHSCFVFVFRIYVFTSVIHRQ